MLNEKAYAICENKCLVETMSKEEIYSSFGIGSVKLTNENLDDILDVGTYAANENNNCNNAPVTGKNFVLEVKEMNDPDTTGNSQAILQIFYDTENIYDNTDKIPAIYLRTVFFNLLEIGTIGNTQIYKQVYKLSSWKKIGDSIVKNYNLNEYKTEIIASITRAICKLENNKVYISGYFTLSQGLAINNNYKIFNLPSELAYSESIDFVFCANNNGNPGRGYVGADGGIFIRPGSSLTSGQSVIFNVCYNLN